MKSLPILLTSFLTLAALAGCNPVADDGKEDATAPVRRVQTVIAAPAQITNVRAFPSVLEPPQITSLAFEVGGRLSTVDLQVGQTVGKGDVLLTVDPEDFTFQLRQAEAAVAEAQSALINAQDEAERQTRLFERGVASKAARDRAVTQLKQARARAEQAHFSLELVRGSSDDASLEAPFDGVINSISVQNFGVVQPGQPVLTLYKDDGLQAEVLVSYKIVSQLSLNDAVTIRPADRPDAALTAHITEIARRAPAVSAFPVVVKLDETPDSLRSGMAVEILIELPHAPEKRAIPLPVSALATQLSGDLEPLTPSGSERRGQVFVFKDGLIEAREVAVSGVDETRIIVTGGLGAGERVVSAGVPFVYPGQKVALWENPAEDGQ
ncbi:MULTISPECIES: efflux RND transporter periplasmic adaptor subunit [Sediminimonas]|uniref:efflux RND transporter periplasmic adaptor subunit n=1 Tax=Sediminimonas TaxID=659427 RepID=UPI0004189E18|nr:MULTISPECIES: efflux RND transporter periplasmic adaptor subunit [Sediminimonas]MDR9484695.1 efflux RND transporter periplasmic adaptor subunit [Sediminimonas sp.]